MLIKTWAQTWKWIVKSVKRKNFFCKWPALAALFYLYDSFFPLTKMKILSAQYLNLKCKFHLRKNESKLPYFLMHKSTFLTSKVKTKFKGLLIRLDIKSGIPWLRWFVTVVTVTSYKISIDRGEKLPLVLRNICNHVQ